MGMSPRMLLFAAATVCILAPRASCQPTGNSDPVGVWRGTSRCEVRPSACHDEDVVFRIARAGSLDSLAVDGRKIVGAREVEMGVLGCRINHTDGSIACALPGGTWKFTIRGDSLVGELRSPDGTRLRDVRTVRSR